MGADDLYKYAVCGICGLAFGIAAEKGRVHEPNVIRNQMDMSAMVMMKMFLGAMASGMATMSVMSIVSDTAKARVYDARTSFMGCMRNKGLITTIIGGGLLGSGMVIAGTCPGMTFVQLGTQTANSIWTLLGCLGGAGLYAILERTVSELFRDSSGRHETLDDGRRYHHVALPLAGLVAAAVFYLENQQGSGVGDGWKNSPLSTHAWPPYIAGAAIGLLQAPLVYTVRDTLGTSSAFCTILSQALIADNLRRAFPYLQQFRHGMNNWWQVFFVGGAVGGAYLSAHASGSLGQSSPVTQAQALLGGAMMIFGARLAGGCTSGHGLSGTSLLLINSFIGCAAMFAGGMATQVAMKKGMV